MQNLFQNLLSDDRLGAPSIAMSSGSILQFKLPLSGRDVRVPFDVSPVSHCILPYSSVIDTGLAYGSISARFKVKLKTFGVGQTPGPFEPKFNCFLLAILLGANRNEKKYDKNILAACHKHLYWSFVNAPASGQAKKKTLRFNIVIVVSNVCGTPRSQHLGSDEMEVFGSEESGGIMIIWRPQFWSYHAKTTLNLLYFLQRIVNFKHGSIIASPPINELTDSTNFLIRNIY